MLQVRWFLVLTIIRAVYLNQYQHSRINVHTYLVEENVLYKIEPLNVFVFVTVEKIEHIMSFESHMAPRKIHGTFTPPSTGLARMDQGCIVMF